jgi:hypothetical protein
MLNIDAIAEVHRDGWAVELIELAARRALPVFPAIDQRVREYRRDRARLVEAGDVPGREPQLRCAQIVVELLDRARADDRQRALGGHPGDGDAELVDTAVEGGGKRRSRVRPP